MRGLVLRPGDSEGAARLEYLTDLPEPEPASGEVLLRVLACGVNHADRRPSFAGVEGPMPRVVGSGGHVEMKGALSSRRALGVALH